MQILFRPVTASNFPINTPSDTSWLCSIENLLQNKQLINVRLSSTQDYSRNDCLLHPNIAVTCFSWAFAHTGFLILFIDHKGLWNCGTNLSISLSLQFRFDFPALLPTVGVRSRRSFLRLWQRPSVFIQASLPFDSSTHEQARTLWRL